WSARPSRSNACRSPSMSARVVEHSRVGAVSNAELEPYKGTDGSTTTLSYTIFSTVPGAPVFVGKASRYRSKQAALGHDLNLSGHNALQKHFCLRRLTHPSRRGEARRSGSARTAHAGHGAACRRRVARVDAVGSEPVRPVSRPWELVRHRPCRRDLCVRCQRARYYCLACCTSAAGC